MHCFSDDHGVRRIDVAPLSSAVASFLELDVRESTAAAEQIASAIDAVIAGHCTSWEATGETFHLALSADGASLDCVWGDDSCRVTLSELRVALNVWRAGITAR